MEPLRVLLQWEPAWYRPPVTLFRKINSTSEGVFYTTGHNAVGSYPPLEL